MHGFFFYQNIERVRCMNSYNEWGSVKSQLSKMTKDLPAKSRSDINDELYKNATKIMEKKSLSLIYDEFGNQLYEKTPNVKDFISCKKNGFDMSINVDESKLVKKNITMEDDFRTDFIPYGMIDNIEAKDVKENMNTGFQGKNDYLYKNIKQEDIKNKVFQEGIEEIKAWFNVKEIKNIKKENKDFVGLLK